MTTTIPAYRLFSNGKLLVSVDVEQPAWFKLIPRIGASWLASSISAVLRAR